MSTHSQTMNAPEPDLIDLLRDWWRLRGWIMAGMVAGLLAALVFLALAVPQYRVSMLIAPADRGTGTDIKALLPDNATFALQYLASSIGAQDTTDFSRLENIMRGADVAAIVMKNKDVADGVRASRSLRISAGVDIRDPAELADWMARTIKIEPVGTTTMRRVVLNHPDREWATGFLTLVHDAADRLIRNDVRTRADARSAYLQDALRRTDHPDHRRALTNLLMEQEHVRMMLAMDEAFAAVIAESPSASARAVWPRKSIVLPAFVFAGAVLFYCLGLIFGRRDRHA